MKRYLFIGLILVTLLTALMPTAALAAAPPVPFSASGSVNYISAGTVYPVGNTGKWRVVERDITGTMSGNITGDYVLTYSAIIDSLLTQSGNLHGKMKVSEDYELQVNGQIAPMQFVRYMEFPPASGNYVPVFELIITGKWAFLKDAQGQGTFNSTVHFVPTPDGHVAFVIPDESSFNMFGKWQPEN